MGAERKRTTWTLFSYAHAGAKEQRHINPHRGNVAGRLDVARSSADGTGESIRNGGTVNVEAARHGMDRARQSQRIQVQTSTQTQAETQA